MKKNMQTVILILVIITGLSLLLYPTVSNYISSINHRRLISEYTSSVDSIDAAQCEKLLKDAREYNERLAKKAVSLLYLSDEERKEYDSLLNITGTGIMGYVEVPRADIVLPIYHGVDEGTLQMGIGHIEGSSLPVGGESTHTIISGHRGLPSSKLFSNIDKLMEGDIFTLNVLGEVFAYKVDQIETIDPYDLSKLRIIEGKDYCTLVTCTPYGINTHRLLVRGYRIETPENIRDYVNAEQTAAETVSPWIIIGIAEIPVILISAIVIYRKKRKN